MEYKRIVAYIPDTSVLFELSDGNYALVSIDYDAKWLVTVSRYAESHLKFGGFESGENIPMEILNKAIDILNRGEKVFVCSDVRTRNEIKNEFDN